MPLLKLPVLNRKIWGLNPKELVVIGARTSQGKSALAMNIAHDIASQGKHVLFLSLEMTVDSLIERMFCMTQKVDSFELLTGKFKNHGEKWAVFSAEMEKTPMMIVQGIGKKWDEIDYLIDHLDPKPRLVVLDYIQNISGSGHLKKEIIDDYIRHLREMAIRDNFVAIVCSQINRASMGADNKEPQLHNLKDSGCLEEAADKVMLLHYPFFYDENQNPNLYKLYLAKNRNGRVGTVEIRFFPEYYLFEDAEKEVSAPKEVKQIANMFGGKVVKDDNWDE